MESMVKLHGRCRLNPLLFLEKLASTNFEFEYHVVGVIKISKSLSLFPNHLSIANIEKALFVPHIRAWQMIIRLIWKMVNDKLIYHLLI